MAKAEVTVMVAKGVSVPQRLVDCVAGMLKNLPEGARDIAELAAKGCDITPEVAVLVLSFLKKYPDAARPKGRRGR